MTTRQLDLFVTFAEPEPTVQAAIAPEAHREPVRSAPRRTLAPPNRNGGPDLAEAAIGRVDAARSERPVTPARAVPRLAAIRVVAPADLPVYGAGAQLFADEALAAPNAQRALFTYRDLRALFGLSRATVLRRMRAGLIPGVRMSGMRVIEDGPVRRFTRAQVRALLMSTQTAP